MTQVETMRDAMAGYFSRVIREYLEQRASEGGDMCAPHDDGRVIAFDGLIDTKALGELLVDRTFKVVKD